MRISGLPAAALLLLTACQRDEEAGNVPAGPAASPLPSPGDSVSAPPAPPAAISPVPAARWELQASGEGSALVLQQGAGATAMRLFCPARSRRLLVNVPAFRPIGSEERLSFGGGGDAVALVADTRGDRQRGGVTGTGETPATLAALLRGDISASYGAQTSGPHPAPPAEMARAFAAACTGGGAAAAPPGPDPAPAPPGTPCHVQGSERLRVAPLRAVGTEPFWAARIEGRCVTYSHPEDQAGTRIWTHYAAAAGGGGTWTGALSGRPFMLRVRPRPGCSDGMSDRVYPMEVTLTVAGEERRGCAGPV
jgi:uncharacterized membrane protein